MRTMKMMQSGFTLIELVVVIVILGILSAVALPKFVDLSADAGNAASNGVAASLASATSVNYAAQVAKGAVTGTTTFIAANVCVASVLQPFVTGITLSDTSSNTAGPTLYGVSGAAKDCSTPATTAGTAVTCSIIGQHGVAQTATVICGKF